MKLKFEKKEGVKRIAAGLQDVRGFDLQLAS